MNWIVRALIIGAFFFGWLETSRELLEIGVSAPMMIVAGCAGGFLYSIVVSLIIAGIADFLFRHDRRPE